MLATDSGFLNTREAIILPSDPFRTTIQLVDALGNLVNLTNTDIRWRVVQRATGMRMSVTRTGAVPTGTPGPNPLSLTVLNALTGTVELSCVGDVLNDPLGYDWALDLKPMDADVSLYRAVAKGKIEIFNQPWVP